MRARYRTVLSLPGAKRMFASALIARLPQGMTSLAILLLIRGATHSYAAAGIGVGAEALAAAASAPIAGRIVDRYGRTRVLGPIALGQAGAFVALMLAAKAGAGAVPLILLAGLTGALLPPIAPVVRALLREAFDEHTARETAYALEAVLQELIWIVGPLAIGLVISLFSPSVAIVLIGAVGVAGTTAFLRSGLARSPRATAPAHRRRPALASAELRTLLVPIALTGMALGSTEVGLPSLALHAGSRPASGLLLALWSVGSMTGGLWYGARAWSSPLGSRYRNLLLLAVVATAPLIAARSILAGAFCALLAGSTIAPVFSCQYALVGRAVLPGSETEAFTWVSAGLVAGIAVGSAAGGGVIEAGGVSAPFLLACGAAALAAAIATGFRTRLEVQISEGTAL
jgi:predicted MFS family arabinose efflux permease